MNFGIVDTSFRGEYVFEEQLGSGGMGVVYKARAFPGNSLCAVKLFKPHYASDQKYRDQFIAETAKGSLFGQDKNVAAATTHHFFPSEEGMVPALVMPYIRGCSLDQLARRFSRDDRDEQLTLVLAAVAGGLSRVHKKDIVHLDMKPQNVIYSFDDGEPRIIDFGISGFINQKLKESEIGGSEYFMAPEILECAVLQSGSVDEKADMYSFGVMALELFGALPSAFKDAVPRGAYESGRVPIEYAFPEYNSMIVRAAKRVPLIGETLASCVQKNPSLRPESMRSVRSDLLRKLYGEATGITLDVVQENVLDSYAQETKCDLSAVDTSLPKTDLATPQTIVFE